MRAIVRDEQRRDGPKAARPFGVAQMWSVLGLMLKIRQPYLMQPSANIRRDN